LKEHPTDATSIQLHPQYIERNGIQEFVILPVEEFRALQERLDDAENLLALRTAIIEANPSERVSLTEVMKEFDALIAGAETA
jgi:PHD/YefM family antitoxin component YafN of YafNO toxin-antitoxin module